MAEKSRFLTEAQIVQNPVLGAYAIWNFTLAYQERKGSSALFPLAFMILPIVLHRATLDIVLSTKKPSGLALFAGKLGEKREDLLALHDRTFALRRLSLESIIIGEQARLFSIDVETGALHGNMLDEGSKRPAIPERIKWVTPSCEKLGFWFAGVSDQQIVRMLNVEF